MREEIRFFVRGENLMQDNYVDSPNFFLLPSLSSFKSFWINRSFDTLCRKPREVSRYWQMSPTQVISTRYSLFMLRANLTRHFRHTLVYHHLRSNNLPWKLSWKICLAFCWLAKKFSVLFENLYSHWFIQYWFEPWG